MQRFCVERAGQYPVRLLDRIDKILLIYGLGEKIHCAIVKGTAAGFDIAMAGNDDDRPVDTLLRQLFLQLQSGDGRHADIENEAARLESGQLTEKNHRIGKALRLDAYGGQEQYQRLAHGVNDRHLIEATVDRLWLVADGTVKTFEGDMEEYRDLVISSGRKKDDKTEAAADQTSKADQRKANAEKRAQLAPLKKKINEIESLTAKLEKLIQALDKELADPALYEKAPAKAALKVKERGEAASKLSDAEEQWLMLSSEYEDAMAQ